MLPALPLKYTHKTLLSFCYAPQRVLPFLSSFGRGNQVARLAALRNVFQKE